MKKTVTAALLAMLMIFSLCACSSDRIVAHITIEDMDSLTLTEIPSNSVNFSTSGNTINITVEEDGDYSFALEDGNGQKYEFTLRYQNGEAALIYDKDIDINIVSLTVD